jgi:hypothetical protein
MLNIVRLFLTSTGNIHTLIATGQLNEASGQTNLATKFYIAALRLQPTQVEPWLRLVRMSVWH